MMAIPCYTYVSEINFLCVLKHCHQCYTWNNVSGWDVNQARGEAKCFISIEAVLLVLHFT